MELHQLETGVPFTSKLRCTEACYTRGLGKGPWYSVVELEPLALEEEVLRCQALGGAEFGEL